jgi:hypothetical protein
LFEHLGIARALGGIKNFDADDTAFIIIIDNDAVSDLGAVLDGRSVRLR